MGIGYCPPDETEEGPRYEKAAGEDEQRPSPLGIDKGGEDVLQRQENAKMALFKNKWHVVRDIKINKAVRLNLKT